MDRYELVNQSSDNRLWDWDLTTSRVHYSPGWVSMLGCEHSELGNTSEEWFRRIHPEDLDAVKHEISSHVEKGSAQFEIEHRMLHHDGCYRWMSCRGMITRDDEGRAIRITGSHLDITAEKVVDALTGLPNRLLLTDRLTRSIEKAKTHKDFLFAVLILDLDLFESGINRLETINGDSLVIAAARRLETALRVDARSVQEGREHLIARSGSEEFIILIDGLHELREGPKIAERLLKEVLAPFKFNGCEVFLTASIGIALSATGYRDAEGALRDADTALYRAKSLGKSRCEVFDTAILESTRTLHQLENELQAALNRYEFLVFYQPIVSLSSNQIAGFEALVRWRHPSRGIVLPTEFIPVAERTGLIVPLDRWVMLQACKQLKEWQKNPAVPKDLFISVNLSSTQFERPSLIKEIHEILLEAELDASFLMLEVTEGEVMKNPEAAKSLLMQLRIMGAKIALDDFGTGYSSLAHLRNLPLDYLKIDRSFIRSIEGHSDTREIVKAISAMARQLGLRLIAEGIENARQLALLRSLQCECGQGFLFSKAVRNEQAEEFLLHGLGPQKNSSSKNGNAATDSSVESRIPGYSWLSKAMERLFASKGKWFFSGFIALLLVGSLLARLHRSTSVPAADLISQNLSNPPAEAAGPLKTVALPQVAELPSAQANQASPTADAGPKLPDSAPVAAKGRKTEAVYSYPVVHNHHLGSCTGLLRITRNTVSFISEKSKDSFEFKYSECSCALDNDRLAINSGSRVFRFKSATAHTDDENRALLLSIYQNISRYQGKQAAQKQ